MPKLSDHSLLQLDDAYLRTLDRAALCDLSARLLADLKEAREWLKQNPSNSSRPPSSRAPWERLGGRAEGEEEATGKDEKCVSAAERPAQNRESGGEQDGGPGATATDAAAGSRQTGPIKRRPGKPPGAAGKGRTQELRADETLIHRPDVCGGCGRALSGELGATLYTGFSSAEVRWGNPAEPGLRVWVTDHRYAEVSCPCAHHTRAAPAQGEEAWEGTALREWRWVGPGLATLIVALHLRFRRSRRRREFLGEWLGVQLSIGTLHQTLQEAAAATAPAEQERIEAVQASGLLHADETSWPQQDADRLRWRWVFVGIQVVYYAVADRGKATVRRVMAGFDGWLMSDGGFSYREYPKRLSGWAHLLRKAKGLRDSGTPDARVFGQRAHDTLQHLMTAIDAAREGPPGTPSDLSATHADRLDALHRACRLRLGHTHEKTKALALEFYNDWEAIFQVLKHPALPLTNNEAERILRHWVIHRRISGGTRTSVGSRGFALLASVIDTCRLRGHSPWRYLAAGLADRRAGRPLASLPQAGV